MIKGPRKNNFPFYASRLLFSVYPEMTNLPDIGVARKN